VKDGDLNGSAMILTCN